MPLTRVHTALTHAPPERHGIGLPPPHGTRQEPPSRGPRTPCATARTRLIPHVLARATGRGALRPALVSTPPAIQSP